MTETTSTTATETINPSTVLFSKKVPHHFRYSSSNGNDVSAFKAELTTVLKQHLDANQLRSLDFKFTSDFFILSTGMFSSRKVFRKAKQWNDFIITQETLDYIKSHFAAVDAQRNAYQRLEQQRTGFEKLVADFAETIVDSGKIECVAPYNSPATSFKIKLTIGGWFDESNPRCYVYIDRKGNISAPTADTNAGSTLESAKAFIAKYETPLANLAKLAEAIKSNLPAEFFI